MFLRNVPLTSPLKARSDPNGKERQAGGCFQNLPEEVNKVLGDHGPHSFTFFRRMGLVPCNIISFVFRESMIFWRQLNEGGRHVAQISSNPDPGGAQRA